MSKMRRATPATNSNFAVNTTQQLVDSLTAHLSLYNSTSPSLTPTPSLTRRSAIIKWFSSLSVQQRRAHLTVVDFSFAQILLQMLRELQLRGRGFFLVMPDVPGDHLSSVPSFCFRKARGLLARVAESSESERAIRESARLFSSREGENAASMAANGCIDSVTVTEELVENVDRFVGIMDAASGDGFLKGEESVELATEWAEMEWLKVKGYYSMEAFMANRLEVALRLAWLSCNNGGKKRGVKLKEKINAATNSGNVFWRKKGCFDWWMKLDEVVKKKVFRMAVTKVAKWLCAETYKGKNVLAVDMSCSRLQGEPDMKNGFSEMSMAAGYPFQLKCMLNVLMILQDVYSMLAAFQPGGHDAETIFFSSFASVNTTADCILQKLREILMVVSLDCTKFELLDEGTVNLSMKKQKEKLGASNHKKKGKNRNKKKPNPVARSSGNDCSLVIPIEACSSRDKKADLQSPTKKRKKEKKRVKNSNTQKSVEVTSCETREKESVTMSVLPQCRDEKSNCVTENSVADSKSSSATFTSDKHGLDNSSINAPPTTIVGGFPEDNKFSGLTNCHLSEMASPNGAVASRVKTTEVDMGLKDVHLNAESSDTSMNSTNCKRQNEVSTKFLPSGKLSQNYGFREQAIPLRVKGSPSFCDMGIITSSTYISYEWPSLAPPQLSPYNSYLPAATDRLHLDAGHNWHNHFHQPLVPAVQGMRTASVENGCSVVPQPVPMSLDWPPVVRSINRLAPPIACNYDSGFISRRRNSFQQSFSASSAHCSMMSSEDERVCSGEVIDMSDVTNSLELADDPENHWMSEDELELHSLTGMDYNQHFGGGVMYWNPSDFPGSGFSRPPSLSSEDSSWAWREADINRAVDDMVAFSSSYSTNGLTSPSAASFCSPFDPLGPGGQAMGYVLSDSEIAGKVLHSSPTVADFVGEENVSGSLSAMSGDGEVKAGDSLHYPILRPIIIPSIPRDLQNLKHTEHKSPRIPPNGREAHRIKRPPSPVVLCVPRAPRPPPPSPVGDSRRHRGFPTVRSGSSSPRHWGVKGWSHDGINFEEACIRMDGSEVVWPSWRNKNLQARKLTQPVPGALLQDRLIAISQLTHDQEHPDVAFPLQPVDCSAPNASLPVLHGFLHNEIDSFCKQVATENFGRKPSINWAVKRVTRSLQVLWPRSRTNIFGSNATGLSLPSSDVDLVVCLPPVRNLEPIKEAGILEGRNGIKETCLQHAARYLANQEWVKNDSLKIVENTAIPIIMLVVEVPQDLIASSAATVQNTSEQGSSVTDLTASDISASLSCSKMKHGPEKDVKSVRIDISFKSPSHTGLQTTELVKELTEQFPAAKPLALVLKKFLADRSLDQSYSGGLSSHCLLLLIIRFLQHEYHLGRSISQNYGSLLMDFLYFFGNVFDPRQMRISVQGSGMYINRVEGYSIDPIYIDDPLFPTNNVGRNCFRIHQCIKAFADAYSTLENELAELPSNDGLNSQPPCKMLPKIIPSIDHSVGS